MCRLGTLGEVGGGGNRTLTVPHDGGPWSNLLWEGERPVDSWDDAEDEFDATLDA